MSIWNDGDLALPLFRSGGPTVRRLSCLDFPPPPRREARCEEALKRTVRSPPEFSLRAVSLTGSPSNSTRSEEKAKLIE